MALPRPAYFGSKPRLPRPTVSTPNPLAGILSNPLAAQAGLAQNQAVQDANAALRQQRSQALIGFGSPDLARAAGVQIDPTSAAAAAANPYSTIAQLQHQNQIAGRQLLNALAGHGLLHSGATGYQQGEQARLYGQATYNATQDLLARLNDYLNQNLATRQNAQRDYLSTLLQAFGNYGANPLGLLGG